MGSLRAWLFRLTAYRIAVATGLLFTVVHCQGASGGLVEDRPVMGRLESIFHDLKFRLRGARPVSGEVVIAAYDEKAVDQLGRWPPQRADVGRMLDKLTELGARAIVFDVAYSDPAFEGTFAAAKKLRSRFSEVSLASNEGERLVTDLALARTEAGGAAAAAEGLTEGSVAARDVRSRLAPVERSLGTMLATLEKLRAMHAEYDAALAQEGEARGGDEALADAVHRSGRVVLGSFLLTGPEAKLVPPDQLSAALESISHVELASPAFDPIEQGEDSPILTEQPVEGVHFHTFAGAKAPLPGLLRAPEGKRPPLVAFYNTEPDADGVIRREPLVLAVDAGGARPRLYPNLDLGGVLQYFNADASTVRLWCSGAAEHLDTIAFIPQSARGLEGPPTRGMYRTIPVDPKGRLLLNYYGPARALFRSLSMADIVTGLVSREDVEGKVVLFGATATGTFDQRVTPFDPITPGVTTHATAMENILRDDYMRRPWWALPFECGLLLVVALLVGWLFARTRVVTGLPVALVTMGGYFVVDNLLFRAGIAVFSAMPMLEVGSIYLLQTIYRYSTEEREKAQIRRAFQFYLNPSVIEEMLRNPSKLKLGGEKKVLTVMFSDIRGFTTISERLSPEQLAKMINEYLTPMTNIVFDHGGTLDKYIGDAVMAIWGAPLAQDDHAMRCCRAAVAMMRELGALQERWRIEGADYPPIDIGIGINSGPMVVGNMGADQRFDYTVLGDNVNLASRLEGTNKDYRSHVILSQNTYEFVRGRVAVRELGAVKVKGKNEPVRIYELLDDKPASGELAEAIALFDAGIAAFRAQSWAEARARFEGVLELWPGDGPSLQYLDFVADYAQHPPGEDWDGVYTMTHK
jgi:adenylate cyclase